MRKRKSLLVLGSGLLLLGFFLPYITYGGRSASGFLALRSLLDQGYIRNASQMMALIGLALLGVGSLVALALAFLGKRGQSAAGFAAMIGMLTFLFSDISSVFRYPGIGLFICLAGLVVLLYRAVFARR